MRSTCGAALVKWMLEARTDDPDDLVSEEVVMERTKDDSECEGQIFQRRSNAARTD